MITEPVLLDTGPLVAILHRADSRHDDCRRQAAELFGPVLTSWAVITEAAWLLRALPDGLERLFQTLEDQDITILHVEKDALGWLARQAVKYRDLGPQLADISLLYLAEQHRVERIFTLDRRDFAAYRDATGKAFRLLPETG